MKFKSKTIIILILFLFILLLVISGISYYNYKDKDISDIEINSKFILNLNSVEEELTTEAVFSSEAEAFEETDIDLAELRRLKEDLVRADAEAASGEATAWVKLNEYDLPEDLFKVCDENLGYLDTSYNLRANFHPTVNEAYSQEGVIIGIANVCSSNLKTLLKPGRFTPIKEYKSITEALEKEVLSLCRGFKAVTELTAFNPGQPRFFGVSTKEENRLVGPGERLYLKGFRGRFSNAPVDMYLEFSFTPEI